jgi:hypothetical protein
LVRRRSRDDRHCGIERTACDPHRCGSLFGAFPGNPRFGIIPLGDIDELSQRVGRVQIKRKLSPRRLPNSRSRRQRSVRASQAGFRVAASPRGNGHQCIATLDVLRVLEQSRDFLRIAKDASVMNFGAEGGFSQSQPEHHDSDAAWNWGSQDRRFMIAPGLSRQLV